MNQWIGKVAIVTGASSGIGSAIALALTRSGVITVGLARRVNLIEALKNNLNSDEANNLYSVRCDVSDEQNLKEAFQWVKEKFGGVNILVNNAGVVRSNKMILSDQKTNEDFQSIIGTNLLGMAHCTRAAYQHLKQTNDYGYIINMNSIVGHKINVFEGKPGFNLYPAAKYGVTALTEVIRQEINFFKNNKVRVTSISPGLVKSEITLSNEVKNVDFTNWPILEPEDISDVVLYVLGTPQRVQIHDIIVKPNGENM